MTKKKEPELEWDVFRHDINARKITTTNIFIHSAFKKECLKAFNECNGDKFYFEAEVKKSLMYYFWCRSEYEVLVTELFEPPKVMEKIDIYTQVRLNWKRFIDYVWTVLTER